MTDTVLGLEAIKCLIERFGVVRTERFISLLIKDPFDYTKWQTDLYNDMSVNELFNAASSWKESKNSDI